MGAAVALGVSLCVLVAVRELSGPTSDRGLADRTSTAWLGLSDTFRVVTSTPGLGRALLLAGAGAALILPVPSLLVPLLGRSSGWGAGTTGVVAGAIGAGVIGAASLAARRRAPGARWATATTGLALSAAGASVLLVGAVTVGTGADATAAVGALVFGFGNGVFVARMAPWSWAAHHGRTSPGCRPWWGWSSSCR